MHARDPKCVRERASRGFTLLEMVIAFTIAAAALVALFNAFGTGLATAERSRDRTQLLALATGTLARVGSELPLRIGVYEGTTGGVQWRVEITLHGETAEVAGPDRLFRVTVVAIDRDGQRQALRTLRLGASP